MKLKFKLAMFIAFAAVVFISAENASAQPRVGGFKNVSVEDKGVIAATNFAVAKIGETEQMDLSLDTILKAEQQVVAGKNYRILFQVWYADGGENYPMCITAEVFWGLDKSYKLNNWTSVECPAE